MPPSEPAFGNGNQYPAAALDHVGAFSEAPGDAQNRVAKADHMAAHHAEAAQNVASKGSKSRRVDDTELARLVAEENASKSKFPRYPGLERWELLEKMGDGAFSNVYRARDLQGDYNQVGIKVVRKYEMNSMQVSFGGLVFLSSTFVLVLFCVLFCVCSLVRLYQPRGLRSPNRETNIYIRNLRKFRKLQRCEKFLLFY